MMTEIEHKSLSYTDLEPALDSARPGALFPLEMAPRKGEAVPRIGCSQGRSWYFVSGQHGGALGGGGEGMSRRLSGNILYTEDRLRLAEIPTSGRN